MVFPKKEFNKASVKDASLNKGLLVDLFNQVDADKFNIHSMILLKSGSEVFHASAYEYDEDTKDEVYSVSKSFLSVAIGILKDRNLLNLDDFVLFFFEGDIKTYLPEYEKLKVKHLLSMRVGQENDIFREVTLNDNPFEMFFNQPMVNEPGSRFYYSNIASFILSAIVTKLTGKSLNDFLNDNLYKKIGMDQPEWRQRDGISLGATGLQVSSHDLARFGLLLLNDGNWDGEQIVSKEYLTLATKKHIETTDMDKPCERFGYGYQFWMNSFGDFRCTGYLGQYVIINKEFNLVFVMKSNDERSLVNLFENYILEAAKNGWKMCDYSLRDFTRRFKIHSHDLIEEEKENR
jgi:CubicO group peptidase (beta-lactamase class C family)